MRWINNLFISLSLSILAARINFEWDFLDVGAALTKPGILIPAPEHQLFTFVFPIYLGQLRFLYLFLYIKSFQRKGKKFFIKIINRDQTNNAKIIIHALPTFYDIFYIQNKSSLSCQYCKENFSNSAQEEKPLFVAKNEFIYLMKKKRELITCKPALWLHFIDLQPTTRSEIKKSILYIFDSCKNFFH